MAAGSSVTFQWQDYLVFSVILAVSSIIGLYFGIKSRRQKSESSGDMITGGGKLPVLPVAMSLSATFTSATTILGIPVEVYSRGGEQWIWCLGLIPCFLIVAFFIVPIFYNLHLTNAYEYLELRFNNIIRYLGSFLFSIIILIYMAAVLYAPAVALSQVTGLSKEISILAMGLFCTLYTSIGGIKAVVWTDAFRLLVVWAGLLIVMFKGASDVGGWSQVWEVSKQGSRLPNFDMNPDPFIRHTFWTLVVGGGTNMMTVYGANQANLQRYASVRTLNGAKLALLLNLPMWLFYLTILSLLGLVMYAYYLTCDPLAAGVNRDQLVPLFVLDTLGAFPGLPGLFVAAIFGASISTVSSGVNSLAAVTLEDLYKPIHNRVRKQRPSKRVTTVATTVLTIVFGLVTIGLTYGADLLGKTSLALSFIIFGIVGGPLLGLIINGIFIPFINSWGAGAGLVSSLAVCLYVGIEPMINPSPRIDLPLRTDGCPAVNSSLLGQNTTDYGTTSGEVLQLPSVIIGQARNAGRLELSYIHYSTLALLISFFVAVIVSLITCCNKGKEIDERTYYKYSWKCRKCSTSSYQVNDPDNFVANNDKVSRLEADNDKVSRLEADNEKVSRQEADTGQNVIQAEYDKITTIASDYTYTNPAYVD